MNEPTIRPIVDTVRGVATSDGAGVRLTRVIGSGKVTMVDPFLLLDEFRSDRPDDYIEGFPPHPHRGFETVTYMLHGRMRHRDSEGHEGVLSAGSVQWMTAGRGIIHSEMPEMDHGLMWGFQLWVNLPASRKLSAPRYQDIAPEKIPEFNTAGQQVRVIAGDYQGLHGPAQTQVPILYLDVQLGAAKVFAHPLDDTMNVMAYVFEGSILENAREFAAGSLLMLGNGERVRLQAGPAGVRLLLLAGEPLNEPVARLGPFVMNTSDEIHQAYQDFQRGVLTA